MDGILKEIIEWWKDTIGWWNKLPPELRYNVVGGTVGTVVGGAILWFLGLPQKAFRRLRNGQNKGGFSNPPNSAPPGSQDLHNPSGIAEKPTLNTFDVPGLTPPPLQKSFIGRRDLVKRLKDQLRQTNVVSLVALRGIGGVGKTMLASLIYHDQAFLNELFPDKRIWFDLRNKNPEEGFRTLIRHLGYEVSPRATLTDMAEQAKELLAGQRILVVYDDVNTLFEGNANQIREALKVLTFPRPALTLITSRVPLHIQEIEIDRMEQDDALKLFEQRLGWENARFEAQKDEAIKLIEYLHGHALSLEIAAANMECVQSFV